MLGLNLLRGSFSCFQHVDLCLAVVFLNASTGSFQLVCSLSNDWLFWRGIEERTLRKPLPQPNGNPVLFLVYRSVCFLCVFVVLFVDMTLQENPSHFTVAQCWPVQTCDGSWLIQVQNHVFTW